MNSTAFLGPIYYSGNFISIAQYLKTHWFQCSAKNIIIPKYKIFDYA